MTSRLLFAWLLAAASPAVAQEEMPAPGAGFDVTSYSLSLIPDIASKSIVGAQAIRFISSMDGLRAVAFSPNALSITQATLDGADVTVTSTEQAVVFTLPKSLPKGSSATLRFHLGGVPARGLKGTPQSIYSSYFACDWMVCLQNAPGDKAMFALDLSLPAGLTSLSVGAQIPPRQGVGGRTVHRWRLSRPYSPYLYGFAAGPFSRQSVGHEGTELIYLDAVDEDADLLAMFADTPDMADFLAAKAGLPLPVGRYAQLLVPGREAQEAATFSLIGKGELVRELGQPEAAWIIIHELAHQWWGNLVTCATWQDFWLNEGITTFMTAAWKEHRFGAEAYQAELDIARQRVERVREIGFDKPLAWGGEYPSLGARRAVQYSKGALFLDHLRGMIGDKTFWNGLRLFTRENAGRTVTSADFQRAMERVSGRDLSPIFAEWVFGGS